MNRLSQVICARFPRGRIFFTGTHFHLTSMTVRGQQVADQLGGVCIRGKYVDPGRIEEAKCLIWVATADPLKVTQIGRKVPQIFDVINPSIERGQPYIDLVNSFDYLVLNTKSTEYYLPKSADHLRSAVVIPHHHCNYSGYLLPEERLSKPKVVGYVGEEGHLHRSADIREFVERNGYRFLGASAVDISAYQQMDIGVAWTEPEALRDDTRSNIKLTNFCAHGIPSVVPNYESYRDVDTALGGGACMRAKSFDEFLESLGELMTNESLRRSIHDRAVVSQELYSVEQISEQYRAFIESARRA